MSRRVLEVALLVLGLVAVGLSACATAHQSAYTRCQAKVNDALVARTAALAGAADQERAAQRGADDAERALFTDPLLSKPADERTVAEQARLSMLFRRYQKALVELDRERGEADKARADHPVPEPPSLACG